MKPGYDAVFTVNDYHDGPLRGVAIFDGSPRFYDRIFNQQTDEYSKSYQLIPLDETALVATKENWEIFLRWRAAFDARETTLATHPALPQDKQRYQETKLILDQAVASGTEKAFRTRGEFEVLGEQKANPDVLTPWQVKWTVV